MLLRSEAQLGGGVPVAFSGVDIAGDSAGIFEDTPQLHVTCAVTFLCFAPDEGQLVKGVVNNTASDSVGLLVLDTFNASITAEGLKGYVHNAARGVWHKEGDEEDEITIGQEIEFVCVEMRTHDKSVYPPIIHTHSPPLPPFLSFPFRSVPSRSQGLSFAGFRVALFRIIAVSGFMSARRVYHLQGPVMQSGADVPPELRMCVSLANEPPPQGDAREAKRGRTC